MSIPKVKAMEHIVEDVRRQIVYKQDSGFISWKPASITEMHGFGDCEDFAILIRERMILAGHILPEEGKLGFVSTTGGTTKDAIDHAVLLLRVDGATYVADNVHGLQLKLHRGWRLVSSIDLTLLWDTLYPLASTFEQCVEIMLNL